MTPASNPFHQAIFLTGPTASGKTAVGVALARSLGAEVIALDSMTLYRGMDIGTAKPTIEERQGVTHHLVDILGPSESASVADYRGWAESVLSDLQGRGTPAVFVGGTPLYLKACLRGLFEGPGADPALRLSLEAEAESVGDEALHGRLREVDPVTAERLHPNDRRRIIRALEVIELSGRTLSDQQREHDRPAPASVPVFSLERPREVLRGRIDLRVEQMFAQGFVEEVRSLRSAPGGLNPVPAQGVGYLEVARMLEGLSTEAEALERTQARTRQFSKRQKTWFRGLAEVQPWPVADDEPAGVTADRILTEIRRRGWFP